MTPNQTDETNDACDNNKDRFVYRCHVPSLQEIASFRVAGTILDRYFSKYRVLEKKETEEMNCSLDIYSFGFYNEKHVEQLIGYLGTPRCIEQMLKNCLKKLGEELKDWALQFQSSLFPPDVSFRSKYQIRNIDPEWCVWSMNGEIDYRKTAKKILNTGNLTAEQKFLIMSEYFMEDEMEKVSLDSLSSKFISEAVNDFICFYWICCLENKLHKVSAKSEDSVALAMTLSFNRNIGFFKEHFWNEFSNEDQVRITGYWFFSRLLCNWSKHDYVLLERIISSMSLDQQLHLLSQRADTIIIFFSIYSDLSQCALWAWRNSRDQMTLERFSKIVSELLQENRNAISSLNEIWDTAYDHQRNFVVQTKSNEFIEKFFLVSYYSPMVLEFLCRFLRGMPLNDRKKLIFSKINHKIYRCNPRSLNHLLDICLPCSADRCEFKKLIMDSPNMRTYSRILFQDRKFETLNHNLEVFSHDAFAAREFKQELLKEEWTQRDYLTLYILLHEWNSLSKFIDQGFENDPSSAIKIKQRFIRDFAVNIKYEYYSDVRDGFDDLVNIVEMVFANDELKDVKRQFSCSFRELLQQRRKSKFLDRLVQDEIFDQKLKEWCFVDDEEPVMGFYKMANLMSEKLTGRPVQNASSKPGLFNLRSFFRNIFQK